MTCEGCGAETHQITIGFGFKGCDRCLPGAGHQGIGIVIRGVNSLDKNMSHAEKQNIITRSRRPDGKVRPDSRWRSSNKGGWG